ncbi:MAG TPA: retroviral-like aspartic protease family protein [Steroidobacteraceae bacterium]
MLKPNNSLRTAVTCVLGAVVLTCAVDPLLAPAAWAVEAPATGTHITPPPAPVVTDSYLYAAPTTIDHIGRILAPVMINGQGPFRFVVDTGASRSAISPALAARLGLTPSTDDALTVQGVTGAEQVPSVLVYRLQAGEIVLEHRRLPVIAPHVFANADGILGVEGFDGMRITVDFVRDQIYISQERKASMSGGWYHVPVKLRFGRLMIADAYIGKVKVKAVIDTGAERTLGNLALRTALRLDQAAQQQRTETQVIGATANEENANLIPSPMIRLGETEITRVDVTFADLNVFRIWNLDQQPSLVLGMDVLGTPKTLIFDYKRRELLIRP